MQERERIRYLNMQRYLLRAASFERRDSNVSVQHLTKVSGEHLTDREAAGEVLDAQTGTLLLTVAVLIRFLRNLA